ncbi:MAG TPA: hypothetical protein VLM42_15805 [Bryobacteraceae bacterium]|nr:hypothetical protein [Bryobacteraceae bacterium]
MGQRTVSEAERRYGKHISKDALKKLHASIAYFAGDELNDIAYPSAADDFEHIQNVPVLIGFHFGSNDNVLEARLSGFPDGEVKLHRMTLLHGATKFASSVIASKLNCLKFCDRVLLHTANKTRFSCRFSEFSL